MIATGRSACSAVRRSPACPARQRPGVAPPGNGRDRHVGRSARRRELVADGADHDVCDRDHPVLGRRRCRLRGATLVVSASRWRGSARGWPPGSCRPTGGRSEAAIVAAVVGTTIVGVVVALPAIPSARNESRRRHAGDRVDVRRTHLHEQLRHRRRRRPAHRRVTSPASTSTRWASRALRRVRPRRARARRDARREPAARPRRRTSPRGAQQRACRGLARHQRDRREGVHVSRSRRRSRRSGACCSR